jgi:CRP-like cAMP-binding protein
MDNETEILKKIPLFRNFSDAMLAEFSRTFKRISYKAGDVIFKEKSVGDTLFIIAAGRVVIEKGLDDTGSEFKPLAILADGEFFGEMSVLEKQTRFAQARAERDSSLYEIKRDEFFKFVKENPENGSAIFTELVRVLAKRLQHTSSELTMLFDMSNLVMRDYKSAAEFIKLTVENVCIYFEGEWTFRGYSYNQFNDEFDIVVSKGGGPESAAEEAKGPLKSGWVSDTSYRMVFTTHGRPAGYVTFTKASGISNYEKNNLTTIFNTIASIMGSAIENIDTRAEAALLQKLTAQRYTI